MEGILLEHLAFLVDRKMTIGPKKEQNLETCLVRKYIFDAFDALNMLLKLHSP